MPRVAGGSVGAEPPGPGAVGTAGPAVVGSCVLEELR